MKFISPNLIANREKVHELHSCGMNARQIAEQLGITRQMVLNTVQARRSPAFYLERDKKKRLAVELTKAGFMRMDVAKSLGVSVAFVRTLLREEGLLDPRKIAGGKKGRIKMEAKHVQNEMA